MRYLFLIFLAACTFTPRTPEPSIVFPVSPPVEINAPKEDEPKEQKQKSKGTQPPYGPAGVPPCTDLDTDDLKESINLKLKCIDETLK